MAAMTCEIVLNPKYREHYDLNDTDSLNAFHRWVGKSVTDALLKKYGKAGLSVIARHELFEDDLGLVSDCDFQELADGSIRVMFSREPYPDY